MLRQGAEDVVGIGRQVRIHSPKDGATRMVFSYAVVTVKGLVAGSRNQVKGLVAGSRNKILVRVGVTITDRELAIREGLRAAVEGVL